MKSILFFLFIGCLPASVFAKEVVVEIPMGTAEELKDWNHERQPVLAEVGDTLIIKNLDSVPHQLHTDGRPCGHGDVIEPYGGTWSCVLESPYNSYEEKEPTRDHFFYDLKLWIVVTAQN
jgi:hypothetical protein